jgi:hypothetical protein
VCFFQAFFVHADDDRAAVGYRLLFGPDEVCGFSEGLGFRV